MDNLEELYKRWVHPLYLHLLHGNFRGLLLAEAPSDERSQMMSDIRRCLAEVEPSIVSTLLSQPEWRARLTGGWYAGLRCWSQFSDELGRLLVESRLCFAGQGYCAALACFADQPSAEYLQRYLDTWLPQADKFYDQHWALPALVWVDQRLNMQFSRGYLQPGGLWEQWVASHQPPRAPNQAQFYLDSQRRFDLTLASALAAFRTT